MVFSYCFGKKMIWDYVIFCGLQNNLMMSPWRLLILSRIADSLDPLSDTRCFFYARVRVMLLASENGTNEYAEMTFIK